VSVAQDLVEAFGGKQAGGAEAIGVALLSRAHLLQSDDAMERIDDEVQALLAVL